ATRCSCPSSTSRPIASRGPTSRDSARWAPPPSCRTSRFESDASSASDGLPQSLLELRAEAAADGHPLSVGEDQHRLAVEERLDLADPVHVDDRAAMHAKEDGGIQPGLELVHRLPDQARGLAGVDVDVVTRGLDPVDVANAEDLDASVGLD